MATGIQEERSRIVYIEPNDILAEKEVSGIDYSERSGTIQLTDGVGDNVTVKNEDLNMSVDLQVIIPERSQVTRDGNITFVNDRQSNEWASLMGGRPIEVYRNGQKYYEANELTTDYTEATYSEIRRDGHVQREMLNIKSISVAYGANFYPEVTMTLVDVRGFALMMPSEEYFKSQLIAEMDIKDVEAKGSFFRSLFHIPYPRFLLTIKGFYGKPVTFNLCVSTFKTAFDSKTGDFNVTVKFIGYMLGLYADLPFNLLLIAPYIGAGNAIDITADAERTTKGYFWDNNGDDFSYVPGTYTRTEEREMLTFVEFFQRMAKTYNTNELNDVTDYETDRDVLGKYKTELEKLENAVGAFNRDFDKDERDESHRYGFELTGVKDVSLLFFDNKSYDDSNPPKSKLGINAKAKTAIETAINTFCNETSGYMDKIKSYINNPIDDKQAKDIVKEEFADYYSTDRVEEKEGNIILTLMDTLGLQKTERVANTDLLIGSLNYDTILNNKELKTLPYVYMYNYVLNISECKEKVERKMAELEKNHQQKLGVLTLKNLGFIPTIRNIFRMYFAHISAFMSSFYALLEQIEDNKGNRKLSDLGIPISQTDMVNKKGDDSYLEPFPMVYRDTKNGMEVIYPGENDKLKDIDEVRYVDDIYRTINSVKSSLEDIIKKAGLNEEALRNMIKEMDEKRSLNNSIGLGNVPYGSQQMEYGNVGDTASSSNRASNTVRTNEVIYLCDQIDMSNDGGIYSVAVRESMKIREETDNINRADSGGKKITASDNLIRISDVLYVGLVRCILALMYCIDYNAFIYTLKKEAQLCSLYINRIPGNKGLYKGRKITAEELYGMAASPEQFVLDESGVATNERPVGFELLSEFLKNPGALCSSGKTYEKKIELLKKYPVIVKSYSSKGTGNKTIDDTMLVRYTHRNRSINERLNGHRYNTNILGAHYDKSKNFSGTTFYNHYNKVIYGPYYLCAGAKVGSGKPELYEPSDRPTKKFSGYGYEIIHDGNHLNPWLICAPVAEIRATAKVKRCAITTIRGLSYGDIYGWPIYKSPHVEWFLEEKPLENKNIYVDGVKQTKKWTQYVPSVDGNGNIKKETAKNFYKKCVNEYLNNIQKYKTTHFMPTMAGSVSSDKWKKLLDVARCLGFYSDLDKTVETFKNGSEGKRSLFTLDDGAAIATYSIPELLMLREYYGRWSQYGGAKIGGNTVFKNDSRAYNYINTFLTNWGNSKYLSGDGKTTNLDFTITAFYNDVEGKKWTSSNNWVNLSGKANSNDAYFIHYSGTSENEKMKKLSDYCANSKMNHARIAFFLDRFDFASMIPRCNIGGVANVTTRDDNPSRDDKREVKTVTKDNVIKLIKENFFGEVARLIMK